MMRMTSLLVVVSVFALQVTAADPAAPGPERVVAFKLSSGDVHLTWLPPSEGPADEYAIYGYIGGEAEFLQRTNLHYASVLAGYDTYAVAAVYGLTESPPEPASDCLDIEPDQIPPIDPEGCP